MSCRVPDDDDDDVVVADIAKAALEVPESFAGDHEINDADIPIIPVADDEGDDGDIWDKRRKSANF